MSRVDRIAELVEKLIQSNEMYETFLNASPWGILVVDKTFHILFMNRQLETMSGYSLNELVGQSMHHLLPEEDRRVHVAHEKTYTKNPHVRTGNHGLDPRIKHKNGTHVHVEISLSPAKVGGITVYFASIRPIETLFNTVEGKVKGT